MKISIYTVQLPNSAAGVNKRLLLLGQRKLVVGMPI